jgi:hypothetical protein
MSLYLIRDCVPIAGCACFASFPLDSKRVRARWAKLLPVATGLVGIANGVLSLNLDARWLVLSTNAYYKLDRGRYLIDGVILGLIFSLICSGQLKGTKRVAPETRHEPTT